MELSKKKRLLILYTKHPEEVYNRKSAIGSYVHCLANLLADQFEVTLNTRPIKESTLSPNPVHPSGGVIKKIKRMIPARMKDFIKDRKHFKNLHQLTHDINALGITFDVILEFYNFGSSVGMELATRHNCQLHLIYDGPILEEYKFFHGHRTFFEKRCLSAEKKSFLAAHSVTVYSDAMQDFCTKNILDAPKYYIHQNIDFSRFHFFEDEARQDEIQNICFVGSFLKWHRVDLLLRVYSRLLKKHPGKKFHLYLVGDGMERNRMEQLAAKLGLEQFVTFTGFLDGEALLETQKKMHIGVMPSAIWYQAPNKIFEYGAMKMACVVPETPTIRYMFSQKECYGFENNNEDSLFEALEHACLHLSERQLKTENMFALMKSNYSKEMTVAHYSTILQQRLG
jgi:glycosyltransferase involved in cell wall biosynthesis